MYNGPFGKSFRKDSTFINVTSLIDVMFLLLIFLVVTTTFNPHLGLSLNLPTAKSGTLVEVPDKYRIILDSRGRVFFGKEGESREVTFDELKGLLLDLKNQKMNPTIVLESDSNVPFRLPMKVFDLAVELGFTGLTIATVPEEDKVETR